MSTSIHTVTPSKLGFLGAFAASLLLVGAAYAVDVENLPLTKVGHFDINSHVKFPHNRVLDTTDYSNITNFQASAFAPGGIPAAPAAWVSKCIADDLTPAGLAPDEEVFFITFSVYNGNGGAASVRPRVRFWTEEGNDRPESAIAGFSFNPISFDPGVTLVQGDFTGAGLTMPPGLFWAGEQFDNQGTLATTPAQGNNFGQGLFDPVDIGSSTDKHWVSTNPANVFTNVPAGTTTAAPFSGSGGPIANYAWEWITQDPVPVNKTSWGRIKGLYR